MTKPTVHFLVIGALASIGAGALMAQTAISTDGVIASTGGLKFPGGTVQATATAGNTALVPDSGQTNCWETDGSPRSCAGTGEDGEFQAGVAWPTPRFTVNGDGTVTDNLTGLIWLKDTNCPAGNKTWQGALDWVSDLNTMSITCSDYTAMTFTDWRLANRRELFSLVDDSQVGLALPPGHPFMNAQSYYWSSTTSANKPPEAWIVNFDDGATFPRGKATNFFAVWPVRGGQ